MKRLSLVLVLILLLFSSCSSTDSYVSEYMRSELSANEKLASSEGAEKIYLDYPEVYYSGDDFLARIEKAVEEAEDYILITTFLGSSSKELENFYSLLCQKAEEGVRVYVVIDGISSYDMTESRFEMSPLYFLKESGVNLLEYSHLTSTHLIAPQYLILREHRKLFVIDGKVSVIGGMNINYISMGSKEKNQRDSMYLFNSASLSSLLVDEFCSIWNAISVEKIDREDFASYVDEEKGEIEAYLFNQGPGGDAKMSDMYSSLINSAKESITFIAFVPALDNNMLSALRSAKERGVEVNAVLSVEPRNLSGALYALPDLYDVVTHLYYEPSDRERTKPLLHEKLMIVDGRYTVIGSTNFNYRSMTLSNELSLVLDSEEFAKDALEHFYSRIDGSVELDQDDVIRMKKEGGSLFSYLFIYLGG